MSARKAPPIVLSMILSILVVGAIALWDEQREYAAALDDFAAEQSSLAREAAAALGARLDAGGARADAAALARAVGAIEEPGEVIALLRAPGADAFVATDGRAAPPVGAIDDALARGAFTARLARDESAALGLPARMAVAGLADVRAARGPWRVAIVATAARVRDRQLRARWRLVLGFALASALIAGFGGLAARKQKKEVELARSLALAEAMRARDEALVRADKLATLGALATGIAHEVSTPLGVIVGRAEQLAPRVASDERAARAVKTIGEQAERISQVIRAFLRLVRGGAPTLERVDPAGLARAAVDLVEHRFAKAGVALTSALPDDAPRVACDPRLFEQVLVNLLLNACDACDAGGHVELAVRAEGDRVAFDVTDDGAGIAPEAAKRVIEPFFTTKADGAGTGLGLAIASEIVKHHHGELALAPRADERGTRATVQLAAARENDDG